MLLVIFVAVILLLDEGGDGKQGRALSVEDETYYHSSFHSWITIEWNSGERDKYRRGYKGSVDVKCVTAADGEMYYRDHLPKLGNH